MARRDYLSAEERTRFDSPPYLNSSQRLILLDLPQWADTYLRAIHTPTAKVGFLLQLGYFRAVTRFFVPDRFPQGDIDWVCGQCQLAATAIDMAAYARNRTLYRHRSTILDQLGYEEFGPPHRLLLQQEAQLLSHLQTRPAAMFDALVDCLRQRRVELPGYSLLREIITQALDDFDTHIQSLIQTYLTATDKTRLDTLVEPTLSTAQQVGRGRYPLTMLKQIGQSMQPGAIAQRVELFEQLKHLFVPLSPLIARLNLTDQTIAYYAQYVLDNRSVQLAEREAHDRYLYLLAFVTHQYLCVGDALVLTLYKAVSGVDMLSFTGHIILSSFVQSKRASNPFLTYSN